MVRGMEGERKKEKGFNIRIEGKKEEKTRKESKIKNQRERARENIHHK